jgi:hypothetical protein
VSCPVNSEDKEADEIGRQARREADSAVYRGSRLGGVLRTLFVAVIYTILFFFATIALIFPAILLR